MLSWDSLARKKNDFVCSALSIDTLSVYALFITAVSCNRTWARSVWHWRFVLFAECLLNGTRMQERSFVFNSVSLCTRVISPMVITTTCLKKLVVWTETKAKIEDLCVLSKSIRITLFVSFGLVCSLVKLCKKRKSHLKVTENTKNCYGLAYVARII